AGTIEYHSSADDMETLAMLQTMAETEGDCWTWILNDLSSFYEQCATLTEERAPTTITKETTGTSLNAISSLARLTAELHLALASSNTNPDFVPEPLQPEDLKLLSQGCRRNMEAAFHLLEQTMRSPSGDFVSDAGKLNAKKEEISKRLRALESSEIQAP